MIELTEEERAVLPELLAAHAPIRCEVDYPEPRRHWWTCSCRTWCDEKTKSEAYQHHDQQYVLHLANVMNAAVVEIIAARISKVEDAVEAERDAARGDSPSGFWSQREWEDWSNELAILIPEDDVSKYANPEGAQESIIEDCLRAYQQAEVRNRELIDGLQVLRREFQKNADRAAARYNDSTWYARRVAWDRAVELLDGLLNSKVGKP